MPVGGRWRRPSRWDVSPAEELSEVRDDLARLYAQVQEQRALIQVQATLLNERTCILGRPLVEMVAGVIILWAVGTEKKKKSGGAFQAFLGWKKKRKVGDLATRVELTRDDLCNKALTCIQGRNGTVHYPTLASLQAGVEEARSVIAAEGFRVWGTMSVTKTTLEELLKYTAVLSTPMSCDNSTSRTFRRPNVLGF